MFIRERLPVLPRTALVVLLCALFSCAVTAAVSQDQEQKADTPEIEDPEKRWNSLPDEKKKELLRVYRRFKSLTPEERERLCERYHKLQVIRDTLTDRHQGHNGGTPDNGEGRRNDRNIKQYLEQCKERVKKRFRISHTDVGKQRKAGIKQLRDRLGTANMKHLDGFLMQLAKSGLITSAEAEKITSLSSKEKKSKVFELMKMRNLRHMEGVLPSDEVERFREMEPWKFHRRMRREQDRFGMVRPMDRLFALKPEQNDAIEQIPEGSERQKAKEKFFESNLRSRLQSLGVKSSTVEEVLSLPPDKRQRLLLKVLQLLKKTGHPLPPELRQKGSGKEAPHHGPPPPPPLQSTPTRRNGKRDRIR